MPISHERRCLFVHVPKTGGTSVEAALGLHGRWQDENREALFGLIQSSDLLARGYGSAFLQHLTIREIRDLLTDEAARSYLSFSFVRNPWDRMVSVYHNTDPHLVRHARGLGVELTGLPFAEFLARTANLRHAHLTEQADFVCDESGQMLVDMVGRFETLAQDFQDVCRHLHIDVELPHLNRSAHDDYRVLYDAATRRQVASRYERDVALFGYRF